MDADVLRGDELRKDLDTEPLALPRGPASVVEGYFDLEKHERNQKNRAIAQQPEAVSLWYQALTFYWQVALIHPKISADGPRHDAELVQLQLMNLTVSSIKAGLDALLAGYYSVAFGIIRHMLESFVLFAFLVYRPAEARRWLRNDGQTVKVPGMVAMCEAITASPNAQGDTGGLPALVDEAYDSWRLMSKGAHPSGFGFLQTEGDDEFHHLIGATYRRDMCLLGFDIGLHAVSHPLPKAIMWTRPESMTRSKEWFDLYTAVETWRTAHREEVDTVIRTWMPTRKRTSKPAQNDDAELSRDDVRRCQRLIQRWEDNMNRMPPGPPRKRPAPN